MPILKRRRTVRLTLRTLLAYLDDTLEPTEIKQIGQKVAESDAAQELVARIKQVTRRRRLTTPPATGPGARFDPNTVAEYLDNELPSDQVAELEKQCLESDVHLAEIAACHQILTLVLGEPALVPPTAKERMYGLVQGREAIPFRKAASPQAAQPGPTGADADADEMLLLGLPFYRRGTWLRWALPLAAVLLVSALGIALWQAMAGGSRDAGKQVANAGGPPTDNPDKTPNGDAGKEKPKPVEPVNEPVKLPDPTKETPKPTPEPPRGPVKPPMSTTIPPPSKERAEAGSYFIDPNALPSILVQKEAEGGGGWRRLLNGSRIFTSDRLVSLPGFASEVRLDSGVRLLLRGHLPEFSDPQQRWMDFMLESAIVLNKNTVFEEDKKGGKKAVFDADLTLDRGRLYISNHKEEGPARVRLRFGKDGSEVWDLTLEEQGTEIGVDLLKQYTPRENYLAGEDPRMELFLLVLKGKASVRIDADHYSNLTGAPQPSVFAWDNEGRGYQGPGREPKVPAFWSKAPPQGKEADAMVRALKELSRKMVDVKQPPSVALQEVLQDSEGVPNSLYNRLLAIYCYCGLDDVRRLIDMLGDENPQHYIERDAAIFTLRRWLSRDAANSTLLYDVKNKSGLLTATPKYRSGQAQIIAQLLHDFSDEARQSKETYETLAEYLASDEKEGGVAIAELAIWHLRRLSLGAVKLPKFNAAQPRALREKAADEVRKLIEDGKLPPPGGQPGSPPPPAKQP
jgi:hypothetical protein